MTHFQVPAVVIGLDLNGLGVVRALAAAGVPTVAADTDLSKPAARTRFATKVEFEALSGPSLIEGLKSLRGRFADNPVLIATQEASVATLSAGRDEIAPLYRFAMPSPALIGQLLSKTGFQALAEQHGFLVPRAVHVSLAGGLDEAARLRYPCVLKPTKRDAEYSKRFAKAYRVENPAEAGRLWRDISTVIGEVIVQEWISGGDSDVYFCLQYRPEAGGKSVSFVGRKLCQWPPLVGGTASCEPAPDAAAELQATTDGFFAAVGFTGLCSMEYKRDTRDTRFYMVEPTAGRTDYQEEIAVLNGVNIPYAAYCGALGAPMPEAKVSSAPAGWRDPNGFAKALAAGASEAKTAPGLRVYDAYFRAGDPMPYLALKYEAIARRFWR